jgi:hypothetical protein
MSVNAGNASSGETPEISITIVNYNTKDLSRQCLASIIQNTHVPFEVFLVDNASKDGSADALQEEFPGVHVIRNDVNVGLAAATNQGLCESRGRYLLALNSDTVILPGSLDRLAKFLDDHPDAGAATARLVGPNGTEHPPICGDVPTLKVLIDEAVSPFAGDKGNGNPSRRVEMDYSKTQEIKCVHWGTAFLVRKSVYDEIGGQDARFFIYAEDVDWSMRISKAGWKIYYVAESEVIHYGGQSTKQASTVMLGFLWKSKCRLIGKHYGFISGLLLRTVVTGVCLLRLCKWELLFATRPNLRSNAGIRIGQMRAIIRAAATP